MSSPTYKELWMRLVDAIGLEWNEIDSLDCDADIVRMVSNYLEQFKLMPSDFKYSGSNKDVKKSVASRSEGNSAFQNKLHKQALEFYTESIALAPLPCGIDVDPETRVDDPAMCALSLGFANRSAVLFSSGRYDACLEDIERALKYNYPSSLMYKLLERKGKCLQRQDKLAEAQHCYKEAISCLPSTSQPGLKKSSLENNIRKLQEQLKSMKLSSKVPKNQQQQQQQCPLPSKSYGQHESITCASKGVDIQYSPEKGRFMQANRDFRPGDVIIIEKPYASLLKPEYYRTHCYNCYKRHDALIPCLTCSEMMYCSENCRTQSWEESHQIECPLMPILQKLCTGNDLVLKIVLKASSCGKNLLELCNLVKKLEKDSQRSHKYLGFDENGCYKANDYGAIYHLCTNSEERSGSELFRLAFQAACLLNCLEEQSPFFKDVVGTPDYPHVKAVIEGLLLRHFQSFACNGFWIADYIQSGVSLDACEIGSAIYTTASLLNHSCDPNVIKVDYQGDTAVVRAFRPIKKGDEILVSYGVGYTNESRGMRRSELESKYYFTCQCEACLFNWPPTETRFKCPHCGLGLPNNSQFFTSICSHCNARYNPQDIVLQQKRLSQKFKEVMQTINAGNLSSVEVDLQNLLVGFEKRTQRPFKEYIDCQIYLQDCFYIAGNYYNVSK